MRKKVNNPCSFSIILPYDTAMHVRELCEEANISLNDFFSRASREHIPSMEKIVSDLRGCEKSFNEWIQNGCPRYSESQMKQIKELYTESELEQFKESLTEYERKLLENI